MKIHASTIALVSVIGLALGGAALAAGYGSSQSGNQPGSASPSAGMAPQSVASNAASMDLTTREGYITISGKVGNIIDDDEFELAYDGGVLKVDTNDAWSNLFKRDANNATRYLRTGDRVTVTGRIDDNLFTRRELDAYALRHDRAGTIFAYDPPGNRGMDSSARQ